jgi:hypothetical protein
MTTTNLDDTATWQKYSAKLCRRCRAACCRLPVEVKAGDLARLEIIDAFELGEDLRLLAKRLIKKGLVAHYHGASETFTLPRTADGDCLYLDPDSRRCRTYDRRPDTCRNHPHIGPRPGFCPFNER